MTVNDAEYTVIKLLGKGEGGGNMRILLAPPYYFKLSDEEIFAYYKSVLENAEMPVLGYNIPQCTNPVSVSNF